nr:immunoglobulin light chain junction region [Macaca mulatta]
GMQALEFPYSF